MRSHATLIAGASQLTWMTGMQSLVLRHLCYRNFALETLGSYLSARLPICAPLKAHHRTHWRLLEHANWWYLDKNKVIASQQIQQMGARLASKDGGMIGLLSLVGCTGSQVQRHLRSVSGSKNRHVRILTISVFLQMNIYIYICIYIYIYNHIHKSDLFYF